MVGFRLGAVHGGHLGQENEGTLIQGAPISLPALLFLVVFPSLLEKAAPDSHTISCPLFIILWTAVKENLSTLIKMAGRRPV